MAGGANDERGEVVCPHCKKPFTPESLGPAHKARLGFKCPHCRLFVAPDRADETAAQA
jgi:hypothetical protein